ncbi:type IX secretion system membrane protein PorP/SprF [Cellulophaga baltica]|uniref:PorP/SprF family type IX secretion system membrane protein n=1 Tax=Cellulophaga TaxID=104264 RepID=UPI001C06E5A7|nr:MULTISPECIES: type IX secretion system membrane protein PorP/SprF [Cellulophaga]MBU2997160.1 type IX secretion system membrane protein PorP/SprF [Cellulophaga baltica]MDO6768558.1 type IX secretion system membrane protein PorP/SprF [Cellulophaga sp. 1_MG-2023]
MNNAAPQSNKFFILLALGLLFSMQTIFAQETASDFSTKTTYHNQLFFNRFLINPTFSLVRENKSYINILHRNQYTTFDDNNQNYFIGFSNKLNDHTALGLGVYSQWSGVVQEFGFNANYATAVQLSSNSSLTFGTNVTYFSDGLDSNRVVADPSDPALANAEKQSKIAIQPGVTLSVGKFDFSVYAQDLFKYNQTTNEFLTNFSTQSVQASVQYTHMFGATRGLFANARLTPLLQISGSENNSIAYVGSVVLEMPEFGWLQTTLDDEYGLSMGFGFNLSNKMSLGYLMEKDVVEEEADLGWNHEISVAYTFKNNKKTLADYADSSQDSKVDAIIRNYEEQILRLMEEKKQSNDIEEVQPEVKETISTEPIEKSTPKTHKKRRRGTRSMPSRNSGVGVASNDTNVTEDHNSLAYRNSLILDEILLRQDSIEAARNEEFDQRFEAIVRILKNEIKSAKEKEQGASSTIASNQGNKKSYTLNNTKNNAPTKVYEKLPIKVLNQSDIIGVKSGYYVIANVYKTKKYLTAFMDNLKKKGLNAKQFYNKENGLYYVYLADFDFRQDAEMAYGTNLNGKYNDEKWIMQVDNLGTATASNMYED